MNDQDSLFDAPPVSTSAFTGRPVARKSDPPTSHRAAENANARLSQHRRDVLLTLDGLGAATADQVRLAMMRAGLKPKESGPRSRLKNLRDLGHVRIVRHTPEGQAVYCTTDLGRTVANDLRAAMEEAA